ncbi:MAG: type I secretion system permease/ATPase, partial [Pseudomonadota bacterium]
RAVYKLPALVVLDEPNASLDADGDAALKRCIAALMEAKRTVVVMAHRPSAISAVNKILMLIDGQQVQFGDKEEVMRQVTPIATARKAE